MHEFIPYGRQLIDEDDIAAVVEVLRSDYLTTGPRIEEFEDGLKQVTGARYVAAVANGTAALHCACLSAGIKAGNEVITTPLTFAASANCVLYTGGKPVFADIDPDTYNISTEDIRRKITEKTTAIIPVHFTGQPCDMDEIKNIAQKNNLIIIEDGAHSLGAEYKGARIGSIGDMTTMSFHPVKHITTGEGGAISTDSEELYNKLKMYATHGITRNRSTMEEYHGPWYYEQQYLGNNYRITDFQAALGKSQLNKLDTFLQKRRDYANIYNQAFKNTDGLIIPHQHKDANSAWHLYVIQLELEKLKIGRREFFEKLRSENIGVNVHYVPVYYHPYYRSLGYKKGLCPNAEKLYERIITLPLHPKMTEQDLEYIITTVKQIVEENLK